MFVQYTWPRSWSTTMPSALSSIPVIRVRTRVPSKDTACSSCLPSFEYQQLGSSALSFRSSDITAVTRGECRHGVTDRRNVPAGLHDGAVGPTMAAAARPCFSHLPSWLSPATETTAAPRL